MEFAFSRAAYRVVGPAGFEGGQSKVSDNALDGLPEGVYVIESLISGVNHRIVRELPK